MTIVIGLAIALIIAGLVMIILSPKAGHPILVIFTWWAGLILLIVGLVLLFTPVIVWVNAQLRAMLGI